MTFLYEVLLYQPIFNVLIGLYNAIPYKDVGIAIIILTILIKVILYPLTKKSLEGQKALQDLQPKLDALKKEHADDKEKLAQEMMKLYKEQNVNPMSSCLPILIQFPVIIALYQVFRNGLEATNYDLLYSFISAPAELNTLFLGFMPLNEPQFVLAVLAALGQFFQTRMLTQKRPPASLQTKDGAKDENVMAMMNKNMTFIMPIITLVIGMSLPGGLTLYWLVTTVVTIIQQMSLYKDSKPAVVDAEATTVEKK